MSKRRTPAVKPPTVGPKGPAGNSGAYTEPVIEVGDYVYVGDGEVHWEVVYMSPFARVSPLFPHVRLESGMSGRSRVAAYQDLRLHSKGKDGG